MSMQKYKICPACGEHNLPSLFECSKCETDLTGVAAVDAAAEEREKEPETRREEAGRLMRVCDCGAQNPPQARRCAVCGEDISDISPTIERMQEDKKPLFSLRAPEDDYVFAVAEDVVVVGREGEMGDYLAGKPYVSRRQAKFTVAAGELFVENLSGTNGTFLNNTRVAEGEAVRLKNGDELGFGGMTVKGSRQEKAAYFTVCAEE